MPKHGIPKTCPTCKNRNVAEAAGVIWCRSCGWTPNGEEPPRLAPPTRSDLRKFKRN